MLIFKPYALVSAHTTYSPIPANRKAYAINPSQSETTPTHCLKKLKSITTYMLIFKPYALHTLRHIRLYQQIERHMP